MAGVQLFALLVGIDKYKSPSIPNLGGCITDVASVRKYLVECRQVPPNHIRTLTNGEATRQAILNGFREHLTQNDAITENDAMLFYFAGHGSQVDAPEGWTTDDGKVETIFPHDKTIGKDEQPTVYGILDRTLWALLRDLADTKATTNITTILDCCHSGSGTRGDQGTVRACDDPVVIPFDLDMEIWGRLTEQHIQATIPSGFRCKNVSSHILLAACRQDQKARENYDTNGDKGGAFTRALVSALRRDFEEDLKLTYIDLLDLLLASELAGQDPQCEGEHKHAMLFSTQNPQPKRHFFTADIVGAAKVVTVRAGYVQNVVPGTEFELFPTRSTSVASLGLFRSADVTSTSSTLCPVGVVNMSTIPSLVYAFVTKWNNNGAQLKVFFKDLASSATLREIAQKILADDQVARVGIAQTQTLHNADIVLHAEKGFIDIERTDDCIGRYAGRHLRVNNGSAISDRIVCNLRSAAHFKLHLARARKCNPDDRVSMELYRLQWNQISCHYMPTGHNLLEDGRAHILLSDEPYGLTLRNKSDYDYFPSLFYFDPSDYSIDSWYLPPSSTMFAPLRRRSKLTVGHGNYDAKFIKFTLNPQEHSDTGFIVLYLSTKFADMAHIAQNDTRGAKLETILRDHCHAMYAVITVARVENEQATASVTPTNLQLASQPVPATRLSAL